MSRKVKIDQLADAIMDELNTYGQEVTEGLKKEVKEVAEVAAEEVKSASPAKTGGYKKGWKSTVAYESEHDIRVVVHNRTDYQLTHLLEYGHALVCGGRKLGTVKAYPHIKQAEENAEKRLEKKVKVRING